MEKGFFKVFIPEANAQRLKIPTSFTNYKSGKLPKKVFLRDRFGNMWPIGVTKTGRDLYFQYGWEKFIEDNTLEYGDFLIFDCDGNETFNFKLLGITGCEKKGVGGLKLAVKEEEEINEHHESVEPKGKKLASDSNSSSSSDDDSDDDYMVVEEEEDEGYEVVEEEEEEDDDDDEVEENERAGTFKKKAPRSKEEEEEEEEDEDERYEVVEEEDEDDEEEENERAETFKKKAPRSKDGFKRAIARKVRDRHDQFGADIFGSGRTTQPKNPYFVGKIRSNKKNHMHVPSYVMKDYKLELPSSMTIRDSAGREYVTKRTSWKDGRICLTGGWRSLYKCNLMEKNDKCICEFVRGKHNKDLYLQVQVLHEGASSRPNKKNKK